MMKQNNIFYGLITALITPFKNNKLDLESLRKLIILQVESEVNGIVIGGSTGEGNLLTMDENINLLTNSIECRNKYNPEQNVKIIAAVSAAGAEEALQKARQFKATGVDGLMVTAPYYVKPNQEGIYEFFKYIHDSLNVQEFLNVPFCDNEKKNLPIMAYCHPSRTGVDIASELILKLVSLENIFAIKDASNDLKKLLDISYHESEIAMLTGNDDSVLSFYANGGVGCVSVISNIFPAHCVLIHKLLQTEDYNKARKLLLALMPLMHAINAETNPVGVKFALSVLGYCNEHVRLPLTMAKQASKELIREAILLTSKKLSETEEITLKL